MEEILSAIKFFFTHLSTSNLPQLIEWGGLTLLFAIIFAETGLLIGFFLPGDSLLVTCGVLAARGLFDITTLIILLCIAAIFGDSTGYYLGRKIGIKIYSRPDSRFFKKEHLIKTQQFYDKYGGKTIVLARFVPIIRTFAPFIAGVANMNYLKFLFYNIFGGIFWIVSMCLVGYYIGNKFPLHIVIPIVIFISFIPLIYETIKAYTEKNVVNQSQSTNK